ncbi:hypothetical protein Glove_28g31 [Diversispora epigaea]|uniref:Uncharacterized protein n=1 Tax=Diversispora epigaea TaxID=1348612 RepID=A0A397JHV2_9GLOM|nr:hypothetical protein Glove_28g31 [Diversispora epigaea]
MLRLHPEVYTVIEQKSVISRSGFTNQHQGLDAIFEEINKTIKSLIPSIPTQQHWEIAARSCTKFMKLRATFFETIGYSNNESYGPRSCPDFTIELFRFRVQIRKVKFLSPNNIDNIFQSMNGEYILSEKMKQFSEIAREKRIEFIKVTLIEKRTPKIWQPIPITQEEANVLRSETALTRSQIISIISSLIPSLNNSDQLRFKGFTNKTRDELIIILQEVRDLLAGNNLHEEM